jgi:hypothetical protein
MAVVPIVDAPAIDRTARHTELWAAFERKPDRVKAEAHRRLTSLVAVEELIRGGCDRSKPTRSSPPGRRLRVHDPQLVARRVKGQPQACGRRSSRRNTSAATKTADYDARIYQMFRDRISHPSRPPATCYQPRRPLGREQQLAMPSYATLTRELKRREDPAVVLLEREGERALQAAFPYLERSRDGAVRDAGRQRRRPRARSLGRVAGRRERSRDAADRPGRLLERDRRLEARESRRAPTG